MKVFIRLGVFTALIVLAFSSCATIVAGGSPKITIDGCIVALRFNLNQDFNNFYSIIYGHHIFEA